MVDTSVTYQLVSIPEAARILTLSQSSVRRLVKAGHLEAERVQRPQGYVWLVKVPAPATDPPGHPPRQVSASPADPPGAPPAESLAVLVQATVREAITPLVELVERQGETIREQAATIGALTARLDASTAPESPTAGRTGPLGRFMTPHTSMVVLVAALLACGVALVVWLLVWR